MRLAELDEFAVVVELLAVAVFEAPVDGVDRVGRLTASSACRAAESVRVTPVNRTPPRIYFIRILIKLRK